MADIPLISRVVLKDYKSIAHCDVRLGPVTFLVGPNGAGKSNFLDAIRFASYALSTSVEQAIEAVQGFGVVLRLGVPKPGRIGFKFDLELAGGSRGQYAFTLTTGTGGGVHVVREECRVNGPQGEKWFVINSGRAESNLGQILPEVSLDRLFLVGVSSVPEFGSVLRSFSSMGVYNPVPVEMRIPQTAKRYSGLNRTGSNVAEVLWTLSNEQPSRLQRINDYLLRISSGVERVEGFLAEGYYGLRFFGAFGGHRLSAHNISDGTLRALGVLTALFQHVTRSSNRTLIGLEEPEAGLHPGAANLLFDAIIEASQSVQVIVTTHSPDLLDRTDVPESALLAVVQRDGSTFIGPVAGAGLQAMRDGLYTAGELMRMNQLEPESDLRPTS